jgi:hypothetical protein
VAWLLGDKPRGLLMLGESLLISRLLRILTELRAYINSIFVLMVILFWRRKINNIGCITSQLASIVGY